MEIKYLLALRDNPVAYPNDTDYKGEVKPISLAEIINLEQLFNGGNQFPKALRELLYLAGSYCYVLDYGGETEDQQDLQETVRVYVANNNKVISRPYFVIDTYNEGDQFLFVYLDEGDDPQVHEAVFYDQTDFPDWIHKTSPGSLSQFISARIERFKTGQNPF